MKAVFTILGAGSLFFACNKGSEETTNKPSAKFSVSGYESSTPTTITFINISSNATSYQWDFGDGTSSTQVNPTHIYNLNGTYILRLKVTGPGGVDSTCKLVSLEAPPGNRSAFSYYMEKCAGTPVGISFKTVNPQSTSVVWDFGNGSQPVLDRDPIAQFLLPGDYTIKYSTQINGVRDTVIRILRID